MPPDDSITYSSPAMPRPRSLRLQLAEIALARGSCTYTLATVVEVRSNSRISGTTSDESDVSQLGRDGGDDAPDLLLVRGVLVACSSETAIAWMPRRASSRTTAFDRRGVERPQHRAVGEHALVHLEPQVARHERRRQLEQHVVDVVAVLAADLERIAIPARREQRRAGALALDDGVGHERRAVNHRLDVRRGHARRLEDRGRLAFHGRRRIVGRRQRLADHHRARAIVHEQQIGEGAADVDADTYGSNLVCGWPCHDGADDSHYKRRER